MVAALFVNFTLFLDSLVAIFIKLLQGSIPSILQRVTLHVAPIENWQAAMATTVSMVFLPTNIAFGHIFQILLCND